MRKLFRKTHMSFLKSQIMIVSPLLICLIICIVFFSVQIGNNYNDAENLFYDTLYKINTSLINADRDFYQAQLGATQYHDNKDKLDEDMLNKKLDEYEDNKQQAIDNVNAATDIVKTEDELYSVLTSAEGATYEKLYSEFVEEYNIWINEYNLTADSGDWSKFNDDFSSAREYLSEMTDIVESWASKEDNMMNAQIKHRIIVISVIFVTIQVTLLKYDIGIA